MWKWSDYNISLCRSEEKKSRSQGEHLVKRKQQPSPICGLRMCFNLLWSWEMCTICWLRLPRSVRHRFNSSLRFSEISSQHFLEFLNTRSWFTSGSLRRQNSYDNQSVALQSRCLATIWYCCDSLAAARHFQADCQNQVDKEIRQGMEFSTILQIKEIIVPS